MDNDPQTTMLILSLFALPIMYKLGESHGRYNEIDKRMSEGKNWNSTDWSRHKEDGEFWTKILAGWLLLIFLVPLFI